MLYRIMLLGSFNVLMAACGSNGVDKVGTANVNSDSLKNDVNNAAVNNACDTSIIKDAAYSSQNDKFIADRLENELACKNIDRAFEGVKREFKTSKNKFSPDVYDTVATYKVDCDTVSYLSTKDNCFPLYVSIQSGRMVFDNGTIKVGMEKEKLVERLHLSKVTSDAIKINDLEGGNEVIFVFKSNKLTRIVYSNLFVD